jgi:hypothetical protein
VQVAETQAKSEWQRDHERLMHENMQQRHRYIARVNDFSFSDWGHHERETLLLTNITRVDGTLSPVSACQELERGKWAQDLSIGDVIEFDASTRPISRQCYSPRGNPYYEHLVIVRFPTKLKVKATS